MVAAVLSQGFFVCHLIPPEMPVALGILSTPQLMEGNRVAFNTLDAYTLFGLGVSIAVFWLFSTDLDSSQGEWEVGWIERNFVSPLADFSHHSSFSAPSAQYHFAIILTLINLLNYLKISTLHDLELVRDSKSLSSCSNCYGD